MGSSLAGDGVDDLRAMLGGRQYLSVYLYLSPVYQLPTGIVDQQSLVLPLPSAHWYKFSNQSGQSSVSRFMYSVVRRYLLKCLNANRSAECFHLPASNRPGDQYIVR